MLTSEAPSLGILRSCVQFRAPAFSEDSSALKVSTCSSELSAPTEYVLPVVVYIVAVQA